MSSIARYRVPIVILSHSGDDSTRLDVQVGRQGTLYAARCHSMHDYGRSYRNVRLRILPRGLIFDLWS